MTTSGVAAGKWGWCKMGAMQRVVAGGKIRAEDHNSVVETVRRLHALTETEDIPVEGSKFGGSPSFGDVAYVNDMAVEFGWKEADTVTGKGYEMVAVQVVGESELKSALGVDQIFGADVDYKDSPDTAIEPKRYHFEDTQEVTPFRPNGKSGGAFDGWMGLPIRDLHATGLHGFTMQFEALDDESGAKKSMEGYCFANTASADTVKELVKNALGSYFKTGPEVYYDRAWCSMTTAGSKPATGDKGAWTTGPRIIQRGFATVEEKEHKRAFDIEWRDKTEDPDTGEVTEGGWYLMRCYWQEGGFTRHESDLKIDLEDETSDSSSSSSDEPTKFKDGTFLCFQKRLYGEGEKGSDGKKESQFEFVKFETLEELNDKQADDQYYVIPLYVTTESTNPNDWTDLRTKPEAQVFDLLQE